MAGILPSPTSPLGYTAHTATFTDTHSQMHGRNMTNGLVNPRAYGALGNGATDDTAAFALMEADALARGILTYYISAGYYRVDDWTPQPNQTGLQIYGDAAMTSIQPWTNSPNTGAVLTLDRQIRPVVRDIQINGNGSTPKACMGIRCIPNGQAHLYQNVWVRACTTGIKIEPDPGGTSGQNDKFTYVNCHLLDNNTGIHKNGENSQNHVWIGGDIATNVDYGVNLELGDWYQVGGHATGGGTLYYVHGGATQLQLHHVLFENSVTGIDYGGTTFPLILDGCVIAANTTPVIQRGNATVHTRNSLWANQGLELTAAVTDGVFIDEDCTYPGGGSQWIVPVPSNQMRIKTSRNSYTREKFFAINSLTVPVVSETVGGQYVNRSGIASMALAGTPSDASFANLGGAPASGTMVADTTASKFWVRVGSTWKYVPLSAATVQTYAASNVVTDRTYDANATSTDELADVLGTLIADLRAAGLVA